MLLTDSKCDVRLLKTTRIYCKKPVIKMTADRLKIVSRFLFNMKYNWEYKSILNLQGWSILVYYFLSTFSSMLLCFFVLFWFFFFFFFCILYGDVGHTWEKQWKHRVLRVKSLYNFTYIISLSSNDIANFISSILHVGSSSCDFFGLRCYDKLTHLGLRYYVNEID